ncbi:MAG: RNA pseudouridine synthase [Bacteroidetes bacterium]|nr:RNA pseudouridine synthase [Bacteroidota bacterium]
MTNTQNLIEVLYEDNHIIAINKKSSDIVQGDKTGDTPLNEIVKAFLKEKYNKPGDVYLGTTHRIDRPVSGIVLFAKTSKALERLNKMFQDKDIQKTYWAIVKNKPEINEGHLIHYLKKNEKNNKSTAYSKEVTDSKKSELTYKVIHQFNSYYLLEIKPLTGRHHQIRVQLSAVNCPIKGDLKYGFNRSNPDASISLHARKIEFIHPVTKEPITIIAPPNLSDPLWREAQNKFQ